MRKYIFDWSAIWRGGRKNDPDHVGHLQQARNDPVPFHAPYELDTNYLWKTLAEKKTCPDCGSNPVKMLEGASGGMSTNIFCANCGHGYNVTPMIQTAEDIGINLRYCENEQIKARRALQHRFEPR